MLIDTHCHLDDAGLSGRLPSVLSGAAAAGVTAFLIPGVAPCGWSAIAGICRSHPHIFPAFGVHPMHADLVHEASLDELERRAPHACAIGEIGLDYLLPSPSREVQQRAFLAQLRLARRHGLPVLIHCRRAFQDLLAILAAEGIGAGGVMHAFSGSVETARACLKLGLYISVCGTVTFRNAVKPVAVAAEIPLHRILLETDAPDIPPEPHRGEVNLPEHLLITARKVAEVKMVTVQELASATSANACSLFRLTL